MTAPVFQNGEWLCPEDHVSEERRREREGLGGSNFKGTKAHWENLSAASDGPRFLGGDRVDPNQAQNRKAMMSEFMNLVNDPVNDEVDGINHPKVPDSGRRGFGGYGGPGGFGGPGAPPQFPMGGHRFENATPAQTIEQLPEDLRQLIIDWAHEQDKLRNDGRVHVPRDSEAGEPSAPGDGFGGSSKGNAPDDPIANLKRMAPDALNKLLHPKKRYYTNSNYYDTSIDSGKGDFPENVQQKQRAKNIAETLLTKEDERAHGLFKSTIERNFDAQLENYIRNTRWKVGIDGFPEYPTPIKDYLTHRFLAIDATQPVVVNHHQHIYTKNEFEHHHHTERAPHGNVTPEQAFRLITGLKDSKNKGANLFEEARRRAENYVVDESNVKSSAARSVSPTLARMLSEVNEPLNNPGYDATYDGDKDKKIAELQQIIRAQQEEIARLRASGNDSSEIPASPMGVSREEEVEVAPPPPPGPMFDYDWSKKFWPFQ